jgi:tRNA pseudouridine55 synthase
VPRGGSRYGQGLDGVLVVDKPAGPTSHDVVALVRRLASTRRVGHGGTLDPFASGVLPLFLGRATRLAEYHLGAPKGYRATVCFGASSTTDDLEGELTPVDSAPARDALAATLPGFSGPLRQRPPAYSAVKVGGRRAYAAARAGETPTLRERDVTVTRLELVEWDDRDPSRPIAVLDVECSAGTYVRALARDLGAAVGSAAYLGALRRTRSGAFTLDQAIALDVLRDAAVGGPSAIAGHLRPIDAGLDDAIPAITLSDAQVDAAVEGQFVRVATRAEIVRLLDPTGRLVGIGRRADGRIVPTKILVDRAPRPTAVRERARRPLDAEIAADRDPPESVDPDPASPDDG